MKINTVPFSIALLFAFSASVATADPRSLGTETGNSIEEGYHVTRPDEFPALSRAIGYVRFVVSKAIEDSQTKDSIDRELEKVRWHIAQNYLAVQNDRLTQTATSEKRSDQKMIRAHVFVSPELNTIVLSQHTLGLTDREFGEAVLHEIGHTLLIQSVGNRKATPEEEAFIEQWAQHVVEAGENLRRIEPVEERRFATLVASRQKPGSSSVSALEGQLVPVGERHRYEYAFKRWNVYANPFGWFLGLFGVGISYALHPNVSLFGEAGLVYTFRDDDPAVGGSFTTGATFWFRKVYSGFYLEPGVTLAIAKIRRQKETHLLGGPQLIAGWGWFWDSGFNINLGLGLGHYFGGGNKFDDSATFDGLYPAGRLVFGYSF